MRRWKAAGSAGAAATASGVVVGAVGTGAGCAAGAAAGAGATASGGMVGAGGTGAGWAAGAAAGSALPGTCAAAVKPDAPNARTSTSAPAIFETDIMLSEIP
ncbi:MAG: hypothetical protein PVSMB6_12160 [Steroidobacteraceae bacterium]